MLAPIDRAETIQDGRRALAFQRSHDVAERRGRRVPQQHVYVILFAVPLQNSAIVFEGDTIHTGLDKVSLLRSECMPAKFGAKHDVCGQVVNTVACTVKIKIPDTLAHRLDSLLPVAASSVARMLRNRGESSSKYYPELPSVVSKSLIAKYQRNPKCRAVSSLIIPVCGDKERQIKFEGAGVRIPALFQKEILPLALPHPCVADELGRRNISVEFFMRRGEWYGAFSYNTLAAPRFQPTGMVGVDRNSVGHVATMADPQTGTVLHLGFNPARTKASWRGRKRNLQKGRKHRLLCMIKRKQSRRTKHENHTVSKSHRGLRRHTSTRHCHRRPGASAGEGFQDPFLYGAVAVGLRSASPVHSLQGRFARGRGYPGSPCLQFAGVFQMPRIDQADR
jgi:hypothetical protein